MVRTTTTRRGRKKDVVTSKYTKTIPSYSSPSPESVSPAFSLKQFSLPSPSRLLIALAVIVVLLLAFYKKEWFIAATLNGKPISTLELLARMNAQYKTQTLEELINEKVILQEAKKQGVTVSESDIDAKIAEFETNFGGAETLDSLLAQQGQTRETLRNTIRVQLALEKMYAQEAAVSAEEIDKFIAENKSLLRATDSAGQKKEAEDLLRQQKLSTIFREKFDQLKQQATIKIF